MAEIDEVKERINYMKVWLGIFVVTTIGLIGWLATNYQSLNQLQLILSTFGFIVLVVVIHLLNRKILNQIRSLRSL